MELCGHLDGEVNTDAVDRFRDNCRVPPTLLTAGKSDGALGTVAMSRLALLLSSTLSMCRQILNRGSSAVSLDESTEVSMEWWRKLVRATLPSPVPKWSHV